VASYTPPILSLVPQVAESIAVDRIIDTYVGVALFLVLELGLSAAPTESIILEDLQKTVVKINDQFNMFVQSFQSDKVRRQSKMSEDESVVAESSSSPPSSPSASSVKLREDQAFGIEASSVAINAATFQSKRALLIFMSAEPTGFMKAPPFPIAMLNSVLDQQEKCYESIAIMSWAVEASKRGNSFDLHSVRPMRFLLRPLEGQLAKVERFVDTSCSFINETLNQLRYSSRRSRIYTPRDLLEAVQEPFSTAAASSSSRFPSSSTSSRSHSLQSSSSSTDGRRRANSIAVNQSVGDAPEVEALFEAFEAAVQRLQAPKRNSLNGKEQIGLKMSNVEVITTNAFLSSLRDLIEALKSLCASVQRLHDFRRIRTTQNGFKE